MRQSIVTYLCSVFEYANFPFSYCIIVRMYHSSIKTKDNTQIHGLFFHDNTISLYSIEIWILIKKRACDFVSRTGLKTNFVE